MGSATRARILIVDDHPIVREGLRLRISSQSDLEVCAEAADIREALVLAKKHQPDLALVDISLGDGNGLDLIRQLQAHCGGIRILVLSGHDESLYAERAVQAGAHGYICKSQAQGNILNALRAVRDGGYYLSPELNSRLIARTRPMRGAQTSSLLGELSNRELHVFQLIGQGRNTKAIAAELHLSPHTVDRHREKIKAKLNLKNALELQRAALQWALAPERE